MTTGAAWNLDNPLKPWAYFDPDATRDIPFEWDLWLADIESTYASHTITVATGLQVVTSTQSAGVVKVRIKKAVAGTLVVGQKYAVTCHIVASNGEEEDQTLYLKIIEK